MKKFILASLLSIFALTASAEGWVGSGIGISGTTVKPDGYSSTTTINFGVLPEVGFKLSDHFALAVELGYNLAHTEGATLHQLNVGPYVRWTFTDNETVNFFAEVGAQYLYQDYEGSNSDAIKALLRPGISVDLGSNFTLLGKLNLFEYMYQSDINTFGFALTTGLSVGFAYNF